ncbi:hypothetical protein [Natroniella sp. ANB-PHB2]|uniref:hypothetical protein n=1 Tax=Natroniella sp. ANB-PHB2 TaxID=3384444 RepID=UPI0038D381B2
MELSLFRVIFTAFPESLLLTYVGLGLLGVKLKWEDYITIGFFYIVGLVIVRNVFDGYGLHVLILCLLLALLIKGIAKLDLSISVIASLFGFIILFISEAIFISLITGFLEIGILEIIQLNNFYYLLISHLSKSLLFIAFLLIHFLNFKLVDIGNEIDVKA